ncbi:MAG: hypothetical protein M1565_06095, partial [Actinobacteria bacterium]|nr:hypothetical protein [Actinomycetota bacterium]
MIELVIVAVLSSAVGVIWSIAFLAFPRADPARAVSMEIGAKLGERREIRRFLRARLDPAATTGLVLTFALAGVVVAGVVLGVFAAMIRSNSNVVNVDIEVTRWAATHATSTSLAVFGWLTRAGSTAGVLAAAAITGIYAARTRRLRSVLLFLLIVLGGQAVLSNLIKLAVER